MKANNVIYNERVYSFSPRKIFAAFEQGDLLAKWWGPKDFTNSFETFEFKNGGKWIFTMHSPNGDHYPNECVFREVLPDHKIVIEHTGQPWFTLTIKLTPQGDKTHLAWAQEFENEEMTSRVRAICGPANEQNLDRLQAVLK